ncbi:MAG: flagellar basal body-associated FliL family protein [Selenomonadaceae bacterium]|nr:flagellar basal body-associated FliL family protein [Selenomonadaceae bacterium]MBR0284573.1 flagellar basal body-associated FliL family protein [Selenomonadaceae bacterium]
MADEEKEEEVAEEPKKKSPIILVVVLVLVGLVLAGGISFFVTTKLMAGSAGDGGGGEVRHSDPGVFVKLGDPKEGILVNVGGARAGKYLKTSIILEMNPGKEANVTEEGKLQPVAETKILDVTLQLLRSAKMEEFDATKQDDLKKKLKDELNAALGSGSVYDVYITSFLLQ